MVKSDEYRTNALKDIWNAVEYDHYVWGTGHELPNGSMHIDEKASLTDLDQDYLPNYNRSKAEEDVIGRVHVACPRYVQAWRVPPPPRTNQAHKAGKPSLRKDGISLETQAVGRYVKKEGRAEYLLLSGIACPPRRAWLVLYRKALSSKGPFTRREADYARYLIPARLYEWLELVIPLGNATRRDEIEPFTPFGALTPYELGAVLMSAEHERPLTVAEHLRDQFPERANDLNRQDGEDEKSWQVRVGAHVRNTKNTGLKAMGIDLSKVRALLIRGRLPAEEEKPPPA